MSATVHKLKLVECGENVRLDADKLLEAAKGKKWHRLAIIGQLEESDEQSEFYLVGTANAGETLILIELAKLDIIGR